MPVLLPVPGAKVTPCERRVSRNPVVDGDIKGLPVTPCERRVSRNLVGGTGMADHVRHALREACE